MVLRLVLLALVIALPECGQGIHLGIKAGVPITEYFETGRTGGLRGSAEYSAATRRYTVGPSVELRFRRGLGVELGVLYKRMGYVGILSTGPGSSGIVTKSAYDIKKGNSWDFPILMKYGPRFILHPYLAGGLTLRYIGPARARGQETVQNLATGTTVQAPIDTADPTELHQRFYPGITVAGGVELGRGRLHLLPEIRSTHWIENLPEPFEVQPLRFASNQVEFLLGFLF